MPWTQVAYRYDGSFGGFLTCVYESYVHREAPACFLTREEGRFQTGAWVEVRYPPGRPSHFMQEGEVGTSAASAVLCLGAFLCFVGALVQLVQNWNLYF